MTNKYQPTNLTQHFKEDLSFDELLDGKVNSFKQFRTTKKGWVAEDIVIDWLINNKSPCQITHHDYEGHLYDLTVLTQKIKFNSDIKAKRSFLKYPHLTSIDKKDWDKYNKSELPFFLFIVDEHLGYCYGQYISTLKTKKTFIMNTKDTQQVVCFEIKDCIKLFDLTEEQIKRLKAFTKKELV